jgi:hypothetical protein
MFLFRYFLYLIPLFITYTIGVLLSDLGIYELWYAVSPVMHSIGGFVTAWTVWMFAKPHISKKKLKHIPKFLIGALLVASTLIVGIGWEWHELILDLLYHQENILGVSDTLIDLTMDGLGAVVYSFSLLILDK